MRSDLLIYISGPLSPKDGYSVERNIADALPIYFECLRNGWPAYLPHLIGSYPTAHMILSHEEWLEYDLAIVSRCTHMLMLSRWDDSPGSIREHAYATELGLPIFFDIKDLKEHLSA